MSNKSYVTMEQHQCLVCGQLYDTGSLLMDTRLKDTFEKHTTTGTGMCPEHQKLFDDGYVALVEVSNKPEGGTLKQKDAYRTGRIVHLRRTVAIDLFDISVKGHPLVYVESGTDTEKGVIDKLIEMQGKPHEI